MSLDATGWMLFDSTVELDVVASEFGMPVPARTGGPLVTQLHVEGASEGHPNSLTSRHGAGRFPFHTDGAHFLEVPRYIVLRLLSGTVSQRPTDVVDLIGSLTVDEKELLATERWKFGAGRSCFISPILSSHGLRYDMGIMRPAVAGRSRAAQIVERLPSTVECTRIEWREGTTVVIDNHRMLHARALGTGQPEGRVLERVLVMER